VGDYDSLCGRWRGLKILNINSQTIIWIVERNRQLGEIGSLTDGGGHRKGVLGGAA